MPPVHARATQRMVGAAALALAAALAQPASLLAHPAVGGQIQDLTARIAAHPRDAGLHLKRGDLYRRVARFDAAADDYRRALDLDPGLDIARLRLGRTFLEAGRPRDAVAPLDRFLKDHGAHGEGLTLRARALLDLGRNLEAARDFTRAIATYRPPRLPDPDLYMQRARALAAAGRSHLGEAIRGLEEGIATLGPVAGLRLLAAELGNTTVADRKAASRTSDLAGMTPSAPSPPSPAQTGPVAFVQFGSSMRYLANSSDPGLGMVWVGEAFDDSAWGTGSYGVGYETNPPGATALIRTNVPDGTVSVYTRTLFTLDDPAALTGLYFGADYDDGYVAWINGVEVARSGSMPSGDPAWDAGVDSHESSNGDSPDYGTLIDITTRAMPALHPGVNVLAVGVWNDGSSSSELVVVPLLSTGVTLVLTRGPYLQRGTPTGVAVRWRTDVPTDSSVWYGPDPASLTQTAVDPARTTEHVVSLTGLSPATRYAYAIGDSEGVMAGGDPSFAFVTAPEPSAAIPTRIWVLGDSGTANAGARAVRDAYTAFAAGAGTDLWLMLGDNAYNDGTDSEYQDAVFAMYPEMLRRSVLWPTLGNHDGHTADSATQSGPYYDIFTLPANGEAGGLPSGTEAYYSFDHANIHFISLDSFDTSRSPTGAMMTWLRQDLLSTAQPWIVAFWHHPPYSKGSHDSDDEGALVDMRENALPILEQGGVDLVLTGHSHSYERSFLIDGHYDTSDTFTEAMKIDGGDGRVDGEGAYGKPSSGPAPHEGAVYVVAGSSGSTGGGSLDHPVMFLSLNTLGSLVLDVNGLTLDAKFIDSTGAVRDYFTVVKQNGMPPVADFDAAPVTGTAPLAVQFMDESTGGAVAWRWDFDADGGIDSQTHNPSHTYTTPGLYAAGLTVYNSHGSAGAAALDPVCVLSADGTADADGDAVSDGADGCPCLFEAQQADADGDGAGDACDADDDNDGVADAQDCSPLDANVSTPPGEAGEALLLGPDPARLEWAPVPQATAFNIYRGHILDQVPFVYDHACHEAGSPDTLAFDTEVPAAQAAFYYLITTRNLCGEGPPGRDSSGAALPLASPCP